ncbi:sigma 54-interacting transcriptional regulator [Alkalihalobacillus oceani]|uniref:sigma 54-interacting transcriptional regulator n=1 Tax=Halalkalibacter oceani TaxID=1653776 RepID=UPI0020422180|nr:sigma 54-interacting transcriptional regulator [Halalkalibacter oceani]MCM3759907.1 sigma 54-interacting transcriptional regulator [Halalkalibacter oceani]
MQHRKLDEAFFKNVLSSISNGIIVVNYEQKVLFMNPSAQKLLCEGKEDYIGQNIREFIPNTEMYKVLETGKSIIGVKMEISGKQYMVNRTPLSQDGELIGAIGVIQEISQIEHYRRLIRQMEQIIEFASDGIYVVDHHGDTLFVNSAYEEITGFKREELIGNHMADLMKEGYFDQSVSLLVLEEKKRLSILQKIGGKKDVIVTGNPVLDELGDIQLVVTSVRDITRLTEMTAELKKAKSFSALNQNRFTFSMETSNEEVVFHSSQMNEVIHKVKQVAPFPTSILLSGPSGVGKEVIANLIHEYSDRKDKPFIKINCSAIPEQLLESELFGYEKGAFTGARQEGKIGLLELADQGTVLLDELGELPLSIQVKLLRVLQEKKIQRIGSSQVKQLDIRIISATNKVLKDLVQQGRFREDLYYRLQVVEIAIPPLIERQQDIEILLDHFLSYFSRTYNVHKELSPETRQLLKEYGWPGNVRELKNLVESMIVSVPSLKIEPDDLPPHISMGMSSPASQPLTLKQRVEKFEKKLIIDELKKQPSIRKTAEQLGIDHSTLVKKMKKWKLSSN